MDKQHSILNKLKRKNPQNLATQCPIKSIDNKLLNFYKPEVEIDESAKFDNDYINATESMTGDKLLRKEEDKSKVIIRNTSTKGLYKIILTNDATQVPVIKISDETEIFKKYIKGTISKLDKSTFEITYFDSEGDISIEQLNKASCIDFMKQNKLIF